MDYFSGNGGSNDDGRYDNEMLDTLYDSVKKVLNHLRMFRLAVTAFIVGWCVFALYKILFPTNEEMNNGREFQYFNAHRVLFGDESVLMILFKLWYFVALFVLLKLFFENILDRVDSFANRY